MASAAGLDLTAIGVNLSVRLRARRFGVESRFLKTLVSFNCSVDILILS